MSDENSAAPGSCSGGGRDDRRAARSPKSLPHTTDSEHPATLPEEAANKAIEHATELTEGFSRARRSSAHPWSSPDQRDDPLTILLYAADIADHWCSTSLSEDNDVKLAMVYAQAAARIRSHIDHAHATHTEAEL